MHGVDWEAMRERYGALLDDAVTALGRELRHRRADRAS